MKVAFYTLGCKVNQNETNALALLFTAAGYTLAEADEAADVYVVNSCTVTATGDKKSRQWLRRAKRAHPNAVTVLTGCYPQAFPEEARLVAEADVVTGANARRRILEDIDAFRTAGERVVDIVPHEKAELFEELPMQPLASHTRAFLKIEDGCNRRCAYCVIPRARGTVRSRSEESILAELASLARQGHREAVLTGINLSSYGRDTGTCLWQIVQKAAAVPGMQRIRLGSLEPDLLDDACIAQLAGVAPLCPQFHLSLQSGCTATLRRMRRVYTAEEYAAVVQKLRLAIPGAVFTTDVIVGFPGETEAEFAESCAFVERIGFLKVHVFSFSRREGTAAYDMRDQIPEAEKTRRSHILQQLADRRRAEVIAEMEGSEAEVLLETAVNASLFTGYTRAYVPVLVEAPCHKPGEVVRAVLGRFTGERCEARLLAGAQTP